MYYWYFEEDKEWINAAYVSSLETLIESVELGLKVWRLYFPDDHAVILNENNEIVWRK